MTSAGFIESGIAFMSEVFQPLLTLFALAVLILLVGFIVGRILGKLIQRILHEFELNALMRKLFGLKLRLSELIGSLVTYVVYFVTIVIAFSTLGLEAVVARVIIYAALALIVLSIILGIKDTIPNMIAGFVVRRKLFIKEDDVITVNEVRGVVKKMSMVDVQVLTRAGDMIYFPNALLIKSKVVRHKKAREREK